MNDKDEFIAWTQSRLRDAETALHNGDAGPRLGLWSSREPVSVLRAGRSAIGREQVVTQIYRREDGAWKVAHRHGDTAEIVVHRFRRLNAATAAASASTR